MMKTEIYKEMKMKFILLVILLMQAVSLNAQQEDLVLSLEEAKDYAVQFNRMVIASKKDVEASRMALWEAISAGLPQADGNASLNDNLKLMTTLLPGDFFGRPGEKVPVQFGSQFNTSYSLQVSQLLFNASYLVGIQTSRLAGKMAEQGFEKSEIDTREMVTSTYYLVLVSEESLSILEGIITNLEETLKSTRAMYKVGMAELTDVDQMSVNVSLLANSRKSLERSIELNYNILRFQLGVSPGTGITLTSELDDFIEEINMESLLARNFNLNENIDYRLMLSQEKMSELNVKMQKSAVLPSLAGFYSYNRNGMGDQLNDLQWFPNSMLGFQLSVPIFASGQRYSKIKRAEIELEKTRTNREMVSDQLKLQEDQIRYNLISASEQYLSQKENVEVAKRVYASVENKFRQGMASSLDLTVANGNYLDAENNYVTALLNLLQTKLSFDKLLNDI